MGTQDRTRRAFLKNVGLGVTAMAMHVRSASAKAEADRRPNVVVVLTDDQGWGDIHSHGNEVLDTPVMDGLAAAGARFDRFYVSPVCAPTRASLLTGRYHPRTGVSGVTRLEEAMRLDEVTIADVFRGAGYATGCFGKWHNGPHYPYHPKGRGFDEFFGFCAGHWNNYFDTTLDRNGKPVKTKGFITDVLTDAALEFMEKHRDGPFFCYVPYNAPHVPFQAPDRHFDKYKARGLDDPIATIYAMIENVDDNLGRLLAKLDELGLVDDTIVVFFGDNGPNWDRFNGDLRGRKGSVHEGGVRVPCFIRWPGHIEPGTVIKPIAADIDLLPTLVDLAGIGERKTLPLDGLSVGRLLRGDTADWPDRMIVSYWRNKGSVRTQQYRLVVQKKRVELYDMVADPRQEHDLAKERPEIARRLKTAYDAWLEDVMRNGTVPPPIPVGHAEMPCVECQAHEGHPEGGVEFMGEKGWANDWFTHWTSTAGHVYWDLDVVRAGPYEITLMYTCPEKDLGATVCVGFGDRRVEGTIEKAHDPEPIPSPDRHPRWEAYEKVWAPLELGTVDLPKGPTRLTVKALTKPGEAVMDLKAVRLRRLD